MQRGMPSRARRELSPWPASAFLAFSAAVEWLLLTTAVMVTAAPGVGDLGAVGEDAPAVADAAMALERHVIAVLVALGFEPARVDIRDVAGLFQALAQY